jgi:hypothetical protein
LTWAAAEPAPAAELARTSEPAELAPVKPHSNIHYVTGSVIVALIIGFIIMKVK